MTDADNRRTLISDTDLKIYSDLFGSLAVLNFVQYYTRVILYVRDK